MSNAPSIDLTPWEVEADDLDRGETKGVCHTDCPAGEDTRYRLYLTRSSSSPNVVMGYCHNCDGWGVLDDGQTKFRDFTKRVPQANRTIPFAVPPNMVPDPVLWPVDATKWRIEKGLTKQQCIDAQIKYDPATNRVFLPCYAHMAKGGFLRGSLPPDKGYQLRQIDGTGPKYLTAQVDQDTVLFTQIGSVDIKSYVLVEDLASGLAIARACWHKVPSIGVLVNYGVKTKIEAMAETQGMGYGYVWLDNDGEQIRKRAHQIKKTWGLVTGVPIGCNTHDSDPKQYEEQQIRRILKDGGVW